MNTCVLAAALAFAACGDRTHKVKDAELSSEPDETPDVTCTTPVVYGSTINFRRLPEKILGIATLATAPRSDPRLFVVGARGAIWIYKGESLLPTPFIDLSAASGGPVVSGTELGLLGMAFHPRYAENALFFVYYTTGDLAAGTLRDVIARCSASETDPDRSDPASCVEVLAITDPGRNHNGGMLEFGSDGLLYVSTGDGGGPTQLTTSQDPRSLLGKMLRLDIDARSPDQEYGIPADNPDLGLGAPTEVFMLGLRNPWRWSFDRGTGDMWIGDVGRSAIEELDVVAPGEQRGANLGWSHYEGSMCFQPPCDPAGRIFPKDERERTATGWAAIFAGQVYRGACFPDLVGWHFYGDNQIGAYAKARLRPDGLLEVVDLQGSYPPRPVSIHEDGQGELFLTDVSGYVYRLEASP